MAGRRYFQMMDAIIYALTNAGEKIGIFSPRPTDTKTEYMGFLKAKGIDHTVQKEKSLITLQNGSMIEFVGYASLAQKESIIKKMSANKVVETRYDDCLKQLIIDDPEYITKLAALPQEQKRALLYGEWDTTKA